MKKAAIPILFIFLIGWLMSGCGSWNSITISLSPSPNIVQTSTSLPIIGPASTQTVIPVNCLDEALENRGEYRVENNTWGKGDLTGWSQCIGIGEGTGGTITARWNWDWLNSGSNIKAYPEIIFGQKPGRITTSRALPVKLSQISELTVSYDITSSYSGIGNVAFDIWLTDSPNPDTFGVPPITHEIMIWIDQQGSLAPGGGFKERFTLNEVTYAVYVAPKWGEGWEYIAFFSPDSQMGIGSLDLNSFLKYLEESNLVTGDEYLASIELGNEIATGSGETIVESYSISLSTN
jgi:hypothetical protein